ncbi:hypothetical protein BKA58DRAFT_28850 [Alternaria rosae]|uniref:uncharacterized protein n=1 Tax=Alternaria rosae TaxID=1187941 RepID=UPI001E8EAEE7|nr:uncharacterized protein BKA58DRAFT_28850 [Alternaria rosae]KAH6883029.1 hypothetical protein BKA58DRAFT_28850 [Alternaria rosae]
MSACFTTRANWPPSLRGFPFYISSSRLFYTFLTDSNTTLITQSLTPRQQSLVYDPVEQHLMATVTTAGSYEQYKLDTNRFIFWLIDTANKRGYNMADPAKIQQPSKRLKGKARTQATASTPPIANSTASKTNYVISTEKILELAKHIANHKETSTMPKFVWYSYKRAVRTRQAYADRYAQDELSETASEDGHIYFLWLLKYCHTILMKKVVVQAVSRSKTAAPAQLRFNIATEPTSATSPHLVSAPALHTVDNGQNAMAEEAAATEAEREAIGHTLDELARKFELDMKAKQDTEVELEKGRKYKEELALRKSCLVDDMRIIVEQLESDWDDTHKATGDKDYLDEIRATLITEAAFDLIRRKEEVLVQETHEKGLPPFDPSLDDDDFFGKTATALRKIEAERRGSEPGEYLFFASRLIIQDDVAKRHSNEDYDFLVHYLFEAALEPKARKAHEERYQMPLLAGALDAPSRAYGSLGAFGFVSMVLIFAAELAIRIRSKDKTHSLKHYAPMSVRAAKEEAQFASWSDRKIAFSHYIQQVTDSAYTHRSLIIERPFSHARYAKMRMLTAEHLFCGLQNDYPRPMFRTDEIRDELMMGLEVMNAVNGRGNKSARQAAAAQYILPPQDGDFLRNTVPTLRAKLSLVHLLLREEMGLGFANLSPQIFAIAHLYNCFQKRGWISGAWPEIELIMDRHSKKIFSIAIPTKPNEFYSRLLLAAGYSSKFIKKARALNKDLYSSSELGKATHKTCELEPLLMTKILRDYVHQRNMGVRTWYRMDEEMAKDSKSSSRTQGSGDLNILSFIRNLRNSEELPRVLDRLEFDYISLTLKCNELCEKIDTEQANFSVSGEKVNKEADWKSPTSDGFMIVAMLLGDLDRVVMKKERDPKGNMDMADMTNVVEAVVGVMQDFLNGLKT